jgi:hypothetical protein
MVDLLRPWAMMPREIAKEDTRGEGGSPSSWARQQLEWRSHASTLRARYGFGWAWHAGPCIFTIPTVLRIAHKLLVTDFLSVSQVGLT